MPKQKMPLLEIQSFTIGGIVPRDMLGRVFEAFFLSGGNVEQLKPNEIIDAGKLPKSHRQEQLALPPPPNKKLPDLIIECLFKSEKMTATTQQIKDFLVQNSKAPGSSSSELSILNRNGFIKNIDRAVWALAAKGVKRAEATQEAAAAQAPKPAKGSMPDFAGMKHNDIVLTILRSVYPRMLRPVEITEFAAGHISKQSVSARLNGLLSNKKIDHPEPGKYRALAA